MNRKVWLVFLKKEYRDYRLSLSDNLLFAWTRSKNDLKEFLSIRKKEIFEIEKRDVNDEDYDKLNTIEVNKLIVDYTGSTKETEDNPEGKIKLYMNVKERSLLNSTRTSIMVNFEISTHLVDPRIFKHKYHKMLKKVGYKRIYEYTQDVQSFLIEDFFIIDDLKVFILITKDTLDL